MKQIIAFVRNNMLDDVIFSLHQIDDFPGATMSEVKTVANNSQSEQPSFDMPTVTRLEIFCEEALEKDITAAIKANACTGRNGDGKVAVSTFEKMDYI